MRVVVPSTGWINISLETGFPAGTEMEIQNLSTATIQLYESNTLPDENTKDGVLLTSLYKDYAVATLVTGSESIWAKSVGNETATLEVVDTGGSGPPPRFYYQFNPGGVGGEWLAPQFANNVTGSFLYAFSFIPDGGVASGAHCTLSNSTATAEDSIVINFNNKNSSRDGVVEFRHDGILRYSPDIPLGVDWSVPHRWTFARNGSGVFSYALDGVEISRGGSSPGLWQFSRMFRRNNNAGSQNLLKGRAWNINFQTNSGYNVYWEFGQGTGSTVPSTSGNSNNLVIQSYDNNWVFE